MIKHKLENYIVNDACLSVIETRISLPHACKV